MHTALVGLVSALLLAGPAAASNDSGPPVVERILGRAAELELTDAQVQALRAIRDRRTHSLQALADRLRAAEGELTAAGTSDTLTLMQEIGRLQVLSGRDALQQLTPAQRRRWVEVQAQRTP